MIFCGIPQRHFMYSYFINLLLLDHKRYVYSQKNPRSFNDKNKPIFWFTKIKWILGKGNRRRHQKLIKILDYQEFKGDCNRNQFLRLSSTMFWVIPKYSRPLTQAVLVIFCSFLRLFLLIKLNEEPLFIQENVKNSLIAI